MQDLGFRNWV